MSAQYDLYETPDPDCTGEQKPLHARIVPNGTYSKKEFLERVSRSSQTFNYNVIDAVVGVVLDELAETLAEGYIVELGELGHFSISLKCTQKNGGITRLEYSSLTGLSRLKAIDDLNTFIEKGILRKRGAGRTVFYVWQQE